jgi:hypothetical protein
VPRYNIFLLLDADSCAVNDSHWATRQLLYLKEAYFYKSCLNNIRHITETIFKQAALKNLEVLQWQEM